MFLLWCFIATVPLLDVATKIPSGSFVAGSGRVKKKTNTVFRFKQYVSEGSRPNSFKVSETELERKRRKVLASSRCSSSVREAQRLAIYQESHIPMSSALKRKLGSVRPLGSSKEHLDLDIVIVSLSEALKDGLLKANTANGASSGVHDFDDIVRGAFNKPRVFQGFSQVLLSVSLSLVVSSARKCVFDSLKSFANMTATDECFYNNMVGSFMDNALSRAANIFLNESASYGFERLPTNCDLGTILKVRYEVLNMKLVCMSFAHFRILAPFWKGFFVSRSCKTRNIGRNDAGEERECVCFMKCSFKSCPYKHKLYINFDSQRVRIEQLKAHSHPLNELFNSTRLDYIRGYVKYFTNLIKWPTATTIYQLIKNSMSTAQSTSSEIVSEIGFDSFSFSKMRKEIRLAMKEILKENTGQSYESNIAVACEFFNKTESDSLKDRELWADTFFIGQNNTEPCLLMVQKQFLAEMVLKAQLIIMNTTSSATSGPNSKLFSIVYRDKFFKPQIGAVALMRTTEPSLHIKIFLLSVLKMAEKVLKLPRSKLFQNLYCAMVDESMEEEKALHEVFNKHNGFNNIECYICVFHKKMISIIN